jgi:hypothetical protein
MENKINNYEVLIYFNQYATYNVYKQIIQIIQFNFNMILS